MFRASTSVFGPSSALLFVLGCANDTTTDTPDPAPTETEPTTTDTTTAPPAELGAFDNITALTFADDGTLYVGDSGTGSITALSPAVVDNAGAGTGYNLQLLDQTLSELLGVPPADIRVKDLAVHPATTEAYLAVSRLYQGAYASGVVVVNQLGEARILDPSLTGDTLEVPFAPTDEFFFYGEFPSRDLSITDLEVHDGRLFIAGMSNADFASTLWTSALPFDGAPTVTTTEIYHAIHGQLETRAPVRALTVMNLAGVDHLVAAYTCTPLVVFPVAELVAGGAVTGKTIGELGYGNTPGDMIAMQITDGYGNPIDALYVQNKSQGGQMIVKPALEGAVAGDGVTTPVALGDKVDLGALETPMTGILQLADQDPGRVLTVRRDADDGTLELMSYLKGVFFRLSDFQSEYEVPSYVYPPEQDPIREFQNFMKIEEGYPEYVVE